MEDFVIRTALALAWLLAALAGFTLLLTMLPSNVTLVGMFVAGPLAAMATLILIPRSAYRAISAIAVAALGLGGAVVLAALHRPLHRLVIPDDSMGIGGLMMLAAGVVLLVWGTLTVLPAHTAKIEVREGKAVGRVLAIMTAVPSVIVVALAVVVLV
jgi:hypothetical protein